MIIDGHSHAYSDDDLVALAALLQMVDGTLPQDSPHKWQLFNNGRLDGLLAEERAAGVDRLVLLPVATSPAKVRPLNLAAGEAARKHPEVIAFAALHPNSDWPRDLAEAIDLGLKGVKLHPLQQQFSLTDPETRRMLAAVAEAGLPVTCDTLHGPGLLAAKPHLVDFVQSHGAFAPNPDQIAETAEALPGLKIIAAHLGSLYGWDELDPLYDQPNVYFDLAYVDRLLPPARVRAIIDRKGADRIIWGTDAPWRRIAPALAWVDRLDLAPADREKILAANLLGLIEE